MELPLIGHNSAAFGQTIGAELAAYLDDPVPFNHMDLHLGDYITGTLRMSPEEEGIYIRFLTRLYKSGRPFEDNDREMAHLMNIDMRVWKRIKTALVGRGKIVIRSGGLTNARFEKERKKRAEFLQKSAEAAKKRWANSGSRKQERGLPAELVPNLADMSGGSSLELSPKKDNKPLKNNDLKVNTHMLPTPIPLQEEVERERSVRSPDEIEINCTAIRGDGFVLPYASIDSTAKQLNIDTLRAREIAEAVARSWAANSDKPRDPLAKFAGALKSIVGSSKEKPPRPEYTEAFEHWWTLYPRKEGKGVAFDAWQKLTLNQQRRAYAALKDQLDFLTARSREHGNLCPHASTWLNQSRFDDLPIAPTAAKSQRPGAAPASFEAQDRARADELTEWIKSGMQP